MHISSSRCIRWQLRLCADQSFLSLCHRRHSAGLCMLYKVNLNLNHCFVQWASIGIYTRVQHGERLIHWSLKYEGLERRNLQGVSYLPRFVSGMTFPTLCLTPKRRMGLRGQSTVGCFPEFCVFSVFRGAGAYGVCESNLRTILFFHLWPVLLVLLLILIIHLKLYYIPFLQI